MREIRVIAMTSELAEKVRTTQSSPGYGHSAIAKIATGHGPCRHCLEPFEVGKDIRILFTLNPFHGVAPIPQPGPVFVHEQACERYVEDGGYPPGLLRFAVVLDAYDAHQMVVSRETVRDGTQESMLTSMLDNPSVTYVMVRDAEAGCFDFRVERRAKQ